MTDGIEREAARQLELLQQHAYLTLAKFSKENIERRARVTWKDKYANAAMDAPVYLVQTPKTSSSQS